MNARANIAEPISPIATPLDCYVRLKAAIASYGNEDTIARELAVNAVTNGKAAFWTTANYHNQIALRRLNAVNSGVDLTEAVEQFRRPHMPAKWNIEVGLDTLIPLNRLASNELSEAYDLFKTFRDCREIEARVQRKLRTAAATNRAYQQLREGA